MAPTAWELKAFATSGREGASKAPESLPNTLHPYICVDPGGTHSLVFTCMESQPFSFLANSLSQIKNCRSRPSLSLAREEGKG